MGSCMEAHNPSKVYHQTLDTLQIVQNNKIKSFKGTYTIQSEEAYLQWNKNMKKIKFNPDLKDFLYLSINEKYFEADVFSSIPIAQLLFQPYIQTLSDLIRRYQLKKQTIKEELLWYLVYVLVNCGKHFQKSETRMGPMRCSNVLITTTLTAKIICNLSIPKKIDLIQEAKLRKSKCTLLFAPQQLHLLHQNQSQKNNKYQFYKTSDVYSIGILILGVGNLIEPHTLYYYFPKDNTQSRIDQYKIKDLIQKCKSKYSELLVQTIQEMIIQDPNKRTTCSQIFKRMEAFQKQILSKKQFGYSEEQSNQIKSSGMSLNTSHINQNVTINNRTSSFRVSDMSINPSQQNRSSSERDSFHFNYNKTDLNHIL